MIIIIIKMKQRRNYFNKALCGFLLDDNTYCNHIVYFSKEWKRNNIIDVDAYDRNYLCYKHRSLKLINNYKKKELINLHILKVLPKQ